MLLRILGIHGHIVDLLLPVDPLCPELCLRYLLFFPSNLLLSNSRLLPVGRKMITLLSMLLLVVLVDWIGNFSLLLTWVLARLSRCIPPLLAILAYAVLGIVMSWLTRFCSSIVTITVSKIMSRIGVLASPVFAQQNIPLVSVFLSTHLSNHSRTLSLSPLFAHSFLTVLHPGTMLTLVLFLRSPTKLWILKLRFAILILHLNLVLAVALL